MSAVTASNGAADVVHLSWQGPVAVVRMADHEGRNTFGPALSHGLADAVDRAVAEERTRVLVVEGMPELFCAGGSQRELVHFARGDGSFDTDDFFRVFARCPLPVVAAVQGHAIGGGLVLALYADLAVFSERSVYAANFMRYGFTPGMGATHLLPARFGHQLGTEMLYTARNHRAPSSVNAGRRSGSWRTTRCRPPLTRWPPASRTRRAPRWNCSSRTWPHRCSPPPTRRSRGRRPCTAPPSGCPR